jgi:arylsulfatase A-like enzyme
MDPALGRLLDWIENRSGPDAVVIVTSDHGEELGEGGRVGHEYGVSQALIHVPLMIRAPRLSPGERDALVSLQDLHALILGIADGRDGEALAAFSREDSARTVVSERYGSLHNAQRAGPEYALPWISMIHDGTKIVGPPDERFEVLDVRTEGFAREIPMPLPANADSLRESLGEYWDRHRDRREEEGEDFHPSSDEEMEKLRALGYVE